MRVYACRSPLLGLGFGLTALAARAVGLRVDGPGLDPGRDRVQRGGAEHRGRHRPGGPRGRYNGLIGLAYGAGDVPRPADRDPCARGGSGGCAGAWRAPSPCWARGAWRATALAPALRRREQSAARRSTRLGTLAAGVPDRRSATVHGGDAGARRPQARRAPRHRRGLRRHRGAGRVQGAGRAALAGRLTGDDPQRHGGARGRGLHRPAAHERGPRSPPTRATGCSSTGSPSCAR